MAGATLDFEPLAVDQAPGLEAEPDVTAIDQETPGLEAESGIETTGQEMHELQIDHELRDLIPPLSSSELEKLKESLLTQGCRDRLVVWKDHNILLDGHHRYQVCHEHDIHFETEEIELSSRSDAKVWILMNQRGRRNLNESQRAMLAVKLDAIYSEKAKERMGTRTDLGQDLDQGEVGRSAEKAAEDMGISHQTVSFAKKVATKGIPELVRRVESADIAVSAASKIASLPSEIQEEIMGKIETQIEAGSNPKVAAIMREIVPPSQETPKDADELLETFRKKQEANLVLLQGIETSQRPENFVEMLAVAEKITAKLKEIETKSLGLHQRIIPPANCVIELDHFKTFLMSLVPVAKVLKLRFEGDGIRAGATDRFGIMMVEAFLPKELFAGYEELGEIILTDTERLHDMVSLNDSLPGKQNIRLYVESASDEHVPSKLIGISGRLHFQHILANPQNITDQRITEPNSTSQVLIAGNELVTALKKVKFLDDIGNFLVSESSFSIKTELENEGSLEAIPICNILRDGFANSKFDIKHLIAIKHTIRKSEEVILSLGVDQPMILDIAINKIKIKYLIQEQTE